MTRRLSMVQSDWTQPRRCSARGLALVVAALAVCSSVEILDGVATPHVGGIDGGGAMVGVQTSETGPAAPPSYASTSGASNLSIASFSISPGEIDVGFSTNVSVNVSGGTPPLTFVYSQLPYGCYSLNGSRFHCSPSQVGHFEVQVQVWDAVGDVANASANLTVSSGHGGAPKVTYFAATPSSVQVLKPTLISVAAVSQSSTPTAYLSYAFFDLPPGCASFNQTNLTCLPTQAGTYHIQVQVTDGFGSYTFSSANLTVLPSASSGGGGTTASTYVIAIIVLVVVAAAVVLLARRRAGSRPPCGVS